MTPDTPAETYHRQPCAACSGQGTVVSRLVLTPNLQPERDECAACHGWGFVPPPRDDE